MPLSTQLPATQIEFASEMLFPPAGAAFTDGFVLNPTLHSFSRPGSQQANLAIAGLGGQTSVGTIGPQVEQVGGKTVCRVSTTTGLQGEGWRPSVWKPAYLNTVFNPGAFLDPASVVAIIDFEVACFQTAHVAGSEDVTGFWFQPRTAVQPGVADASPAGAVGGGGFGVALNDDGAGNNEWEFISYRNVGPPPLQFVLRVPIDSTFVPDVRDFTLFRWTIVSAASGRQANITLEVNGIPVPGVIGKVFDNVFPGGLFSPEGLQPGIPVGFMFGQCLGIMGGAGYRFRIYGRFGRFTADGVEMQGV